VFERGKINPGCPIAELGDPELEQYAIEARDELMRSQYRLLGAQIYPETPPAAWLAALECSASIDAGICMFAGAAICSKIDG
jgi:hypothetical protein